MKMILNKYGRVVLFNIDSDKYRYNYMDETIGFRPDQLEVVKNCNTMLIPFTYKQYNIFQTEDIYFKYEFDVLEYKLNELYLPIMFRTTDSIITFSYNLHLTQSSKSSNGKRRTFITENNRLIGYKKDNNDVFYKKTYNIVLN